MLQKLSHAPSEINFELEALAEELNLSKLAFASLDVDVQQAEDIVRTIEDIQKSLLVTFFREQTRLAGKIKSLHQPLKIIPASLHPVD